MSKLLNKVMQVSSKAYERLITEINRHYTTNYGCLVRLYGKRKNICIAVGCVFNEGLFIPKYGRLWFGDELLFSGLLTDKIFLRTINRYKCKTAEVTDTEQVANNKPGIMLDLLNEPEEVIQEDTAVFNAIWKAAVSSANRRCYRQMKKGKASFVNQIKLQHMYSITMES